MFITEVGAGFVEGALLKGRDGSSQTNEEVKGTLVQHKSSVIIQVTIVHLSHI